METIKLPFPRPSHGEADATPNQLTLEQLPPALQEVAQAKPFVFDYLRGLPIQQIGIPAYYPKLSRKLRQLRHRNLIYPTNDDNVFVHIYPDPTSQRDIYIPIEPVVTVPLNGLVGEVEQRLLDMAEKIGQAKEAERQQALIRAIEEICMVSPAPKKSNGRVYVNNRELAALKYLFVRDKLGLGPLQPLLADPYIEDISCSGVGHMFIEHKIFKSLTSSIYFPTHDDLDDFVVQMGERIKRPVTLRHPIVDATLPDGSRVNIVYGRDIAKRGSNFTIRKFSDDTLSVLDLIEFGSMNYLIAAYLWLAIEEDLNVFVVGPTASGKTTLLNALTAFIRPNAKIVTIEDTPELKVPHQNWVREVVRDMSKSGGEGVDMFALLKAALRQRPDRILIGEIRGVEGNIAFQAMQTGHGVMATFHASSVEKVIQRLTGDPINVPKVNIDNLDLVVIQAAVRGPDGQMVRRVVSVNEIVDYDPLSNSFSFVTAFRWKAEDDTFEFPGDMNSYLLEQKVALKRGLPESKARMIYGELRKRAAILEKLHKRGGAISYDRLFEIFSEAHKQGLL
ncbi:MAG TPA: type II/IV secretion system ATPase subunit [Caldilineaceae bacterium]|nr:type II/IV secretion system ATPase subunit [Caldilineaceae bacterium]